MKKNQFQFSNKVLAIDQTIKLQAAELIAKIQGESQNIFIELDCAPNGQLNPFHYHSGLGSVKIIRDLVGTLAEDLPWLEQEILAASKNPDFKPDLSLGEKIGLWKRIRPNDYQEVINWGQPFCVKDKNGRTRIWNPNWRHFGHNQGFSTEKAIIKFIRENPAYLQEFYAPLPLPDGAPTWKMTYRLVFFCAAEKKPRFVGGLWISRQGFKTYLNHDSIAGLISLKKTNE